VHNYVENTPLDSPKRRAGAPFNKMPIPRAKSRPLQIKHLHGASRPRGKKMTMLKKGNFCA
jgi:hypothetical protein